MRLRHSFLLGEATTEDIKIQLGSAYPPSGKQKEKMMVVRGRDIESGLPKSMRISSVEIREALSPVLRQIIDQLTDAIEETPPELVGDIIKRGITLCGGVSLLSGLDQLIAEETKMPVWVADDPLTAVVRGCGKVLDDEGLLKRVKVTGGLR
jgi:rod shape-determining protein MreB